MYKYEKIDEVKAQVFTPKKESFLETLIMEMSQPTQARLISGFHQRTLAEDEGLRKQELVT